MTTRLNMTHCDAIFQLKYSSQNVEKYFTKPIQTPHRNTWHFCYSMYFYKWYTGFQMDHLPENVSFSKRIFTPGRFFPKWRLLGPVIAISESFDVIFSGRRFDVPTRFPFPSIQFLSPLLPALYIK